MGTSIHQGWTTSWTPASNPQSWPLEKSFEKSKTATKSNNEMVYILDQQNVKMQQPIHPSQIQRNNVHWSRNWEAPSTTVTPLKSKTHKKMNSLDELTHEIDNLVLSTTTVPPMLQGEDEDSIINSGIINQRTSLLPSPVPSVPTHQSVSLPTTPVSSKPSTPTSPIHPASYGHSVISPLSPPSNLQKSKNKINKEKVKLPQESAAITPPMSPPVLPDGTIPQPVVIEDEIQKQNLYKTELCRSFCETGSCRYGHKCQFAHGSHELRPVLRHPKYKTEICKTFATTGTCPYGNRCRFIHNGPNGILNPGPNHPHHQFFAQKTDVRSISSPSLLMHSLPPPSAGIPATSMPSSLASSGSSSPSDSSSPILSPSGTSPILSPLASPLSPVGAGAVHHHTSIESTFQSLQAKMHQQQQQQPSHIQQSAPIASPHSIPVQWSTSWSAQRAASMPNIPPISPAPHSSSRDTTGGASEVVSDSEDSFSGSKPRLAFFQRLANE